MKYRVMLCCYEEYCREAQSFHLDMLRKYPDRGLVCEECYYEDPILDDADGNISWRELDKITMEDCCA